jgi:hypothetical protein
MASGIDEVLTRVRRASRADNELLVDLMAHVPMEGSLALSTRRDPDFFALYEMQRGSAHAFTYDDGKMQGMAAALVRDGFLDGARQKVGYLGDLRIRGASKARRAFPFAFGKFFADVVAETQCEHYITGVIASNALATRSLTARKKGREAQPYYHPLARFEMASVQMILPRRPRTVSGVVVTTATPDDVPAIAAFLAADHARRPFGYRFDDGEFEHRLARWPGFTLDATFVARRHDARGAIVGVCTAWDPTPVKRYRVMRYASNMRAIKVAVDLASKIVRCPALPDVGEDFRSLYLTNLSVADDSPVVLRAIVERIYQHAWRERVHFFALPLFDVPGGDPHAAALRGLIVQKLAFQLYAVTSSARARTDWPAGRPGFEMALA